LNTNAVEQRESSENKFMEHVGILLLLHQEKASSVTFG